MAFALGLGCSSSDGAPQAVDAGAAADATAPVDAGKDSGNPFVTDSGGVPGPDASDPCQDLLRMVNQLGLVARACNPVADSARCNATANGPCCPISVNVSSTQAVNDFDSIVAMYKAKCSPDCSKVICPQTPSNRCEAGGDPNAQMNKGICD